MIYEKVCGATVEEGTIYRFDDESDFVEVDNYGGGWSMELQELRDLLIWIEGIVQEKKEIDEND